jgi:cobalt-zinc-cadmium efflux system membrane fusion protein
MRRILIILTFYALVACSRPVPEEAGKEPAGKTEHKEDEPVEMTAEAQSHIGLQTAVAQVRQLVEYLPVTGTVQPIDSRVVHVRPIAAGRLTSVLVKVGDRVAAGQTIATFDNTEASEVASQYLVARSELEKLNVQLSVARQQSERNRQLADIGAIPRKEYELTLGEEKSIAAGIQAQQALLAGLAVKLKRFGLNEDRPAATASTAIHAPFGGVVIASDAAPGEVVGPESELFEIADVSQVWVQAEVYEKDLGRLQLGQTASITVDTYPNREFLGRVTYISDILDPQTRTAKVRCEVPNSDGRLKLDMFASVQLPTTFRKDALAIPAEAIQQLEGKNVVFIRTGQTTFQQKAIEVGRTIQGVAEVVAGLMGGEAIVTKGAFHLKSVVLGSEIGEEH